MMLDFVILIVTSQVACASHECNSRKMEHHEFREFGYRRFGRKSNYGNEQSMSNESCAISIGIRNKTIKANCIHAVMTPPKPLQGRMGGLRIVNNYYDIAPIGIYFPRKTYGSVERKHYMSTVDALCKELDKWLSKLPTRCKTHYWHRPQRPAVQMAGQPTKRRYEH